MSDKTPLLGMTLPELVSLAKTLRLPPFTGKQIAKWVYQKRVSSVSEMTDISKENRRKIEERYCVGITPPTDARRSADGTVKYLFPAGKVKYVETVFIPDRKRADSGSPSSGRREETALYKEHFTLCVSCQVGCKMNCLFCQTGKQGFEGNLTVSDILNQIYALPEAEQLTNIVFMGQGEPMDNLDNVLKATELLQAPYGMAWSPKRITVSSVGIRNKLKRFLEESNCHIAISLHSAMPELREKLIPAEKGMPAKEIVALLRHYDFSHQRRLTFEYILFAGVNDAPVHAKAVAGLLQGLDCRVNLIRFHEIRGIDLKCAGDEDIERFQRCLEHHGIITTVRASRGQDIYAACGMLSTAGKIAKQNKRLQNQ